MPRNKHKKTQWYAVIDNGICTSICTEEEKAGIYGLSFVPITDQVVYDYDMSDWDLSVVEDYLESNKLNTNA